MKDNDITRIRVGLVSVGLVGLNQVFNEVSTAHPKSGDEEIKTTLMERIKKKNYIPDSSQEAYGKALLNEFKKFTGQPHESYSSGEPEIHILGSGCVRCDMLERNIIDALSEMKIAAVVEHITDVKKIGEYGILGMPALLLNGKVLSVGTVPSKYQIKEWLRAGGSMETSEKQSDG